MFLVPLQTFMNCPTLCSTTHGTNVRGLTSYPYLPIYQKVWIPRHFLVGLLKACPITNMILRVNMSRTNLYIFLRGILLINIRMSIRFRTR